MRRILLVLSLLVTATVLTMAPPAHAVTNEQTPCDHRVLTARDQATAESFDFNGDSLECLAHAGSNEVPGDDYRLNTAPVSPDRREFNSRTSSGLSSIASVDTGSHTFQGFLFGQEDDQDFNGCRNLCWESLSYDANDYFYFDTGQGSTKVTLAYFESHITGLTHFSMIYSRVAAESSVFSFQAPPPSTSPPTTVVSGPSLATSPRHLLARPGNHRAFLDWTAPARGRPVDAYQVRRRGRTYLIDASRQGVTIRGLVNHRRYRFTVRAHNAVGWGPWSAGAKVRPHG